ncbi:YggT family protein [Spongiibacter taiwanensis]|uniref:YggT family protein n=1 Tax=Spongiibacter taiwanensis TaxID=1748242 RepID=UPI0020352D4A|nr:YggT family protein [Spongiibacter taiwanensis]USA41572.1 YggT family protein [Spongiibacter taiwanensis]
MSAVNEITILLLNTVITLVMLAFLLRMLLQLVRADFYNPICQHLVKATNPVVLPLRRILPPLWSIDSASLLCALIVQAIGITLLAQLYFGLFPNPAQILLWSVLGLCGALLNIYFVAIIASIILSWVAQGSYNPAVQLLQQLTEPVMAPFRKLLPNMGGLDFSPILVFLLINVLEVILRHMAASVGLHPALVLGI